MNVALDLKHLREFAFSMTAKQSGESIIALIDEIETLYTLAQEMAEALEAAKERIIDAKATARGKDTVMIDIEATLTQMDGV